MLPVLLDLKVIKIYTFGIFLVLAFFWGCFLLWRNIRLTSHKEEDIFDGLFITLAGGLFTGRLFYVLLNFKDFGPDLLKFILINGYPGISLFGALVGACTVLYLFFLAKKIKFHETIDYFISPLFIALAFGKLGEFFSGGEVGSRTKFFLSIKYIGFEGSRHLTALYEGILFFLAAYFAQKILFQIRREKYSHGFLFYFFWWYLGIVYFVFDKLKINHLYFFGQSFNGRAALLILLTTTLYFLYYFKNPIGGKLAFINNFFKHHGLKSLEKIRFWTKRTTGTRKKENS